MQTQSILHIWRNKHHWSGVTFGNFRYQRCAVTTYARLQEGFRNVILGIDITGWQKRREEES